MIPDSLFDVYASPAGQVSTKIRDADGPSQTFIWFQFLEVTAGGLRRPLCESLADEHGGERTRAGRVHLTWADA